jgi:hypothetical protein
MRDIHYVLRQSTAQVPGFQPSGQGIGMMISRKVYTGSGESQRTGGKQEVSPSEHLSHHSSCHLSSVYLL